MRKIGKHVFFVLCCSILAFTSITCAATPVSPPGGGDPHWAIPIEQYLEDGETGVVDFSYAGYMANEQALPNVPVKVVVNPAAGDDGQRIQAALDYVGRLQPDAQGVRGAVLLKPGDYEVANQLVISQSGVILRGSGPCTEWNTFDRYRTRPQNPDSSFRPG